MARAGGHHVRPIRSIHFVDKPLKNDDGVDHDVLPDLFGPVHRYL